MPPASAGGIITVNLNPMRLAFRMPPASAGGRITFRADAAHRLKVTIPRAKAGGFPKQLVCLRGRLMVKLPLT